MFLILFYFSICFKLFIIQENIHILLKPVLLLGLNLTNIALSTKKAGTMNNPVVMGTLRAQTVTSKCYLPLKFFFLTKILEKWLKMWCGANNVEDGPCTSESFHIISGKKLSKTIREHQKYSEANLKGCLLVKDGTIWAAIRITTLTWNIPNMFKPMSL